MIYKTVLYKYHATLHVSTETLTNVHMNWTHAGKHERACKRVKEKDRERKRELDGKEADIDKKEKERDRQSKI